MYVRWGKKGGCAKEHPSQSIIIIDFDTNIRSWDKFSGNRITLLWALKKPKNTESVAEGKSEEFIRLSLIAFKNALNYGGCQWKRVESYHVG